MDTNSRQMTVYFTGQFDSYNFDDYLDILYLKWQQFHKIDLVDPSSLRDRWLFSESLLLTVSESTHCVSVRRINRRNFLVRLDGAILCLFASALFCCITFVVPRLPKTSTELLCFTYPTLSCCRQAFDWFSSSVGANPEGEENRLSKGNELCYSMQ